MLLRQWMIQFGEQTGAVFVHYSNAERPFTMTVRVQLPYFDHVEVDFNRTEDLYEFIKEIFFDYGDFLLELSKGEQCEYL
jgi:hypothetical protein